MTTALIGQRIEQIRKNHGLTQKAFGAILAVTPAYISAIESGRKMPSPILNKLACHEFNVRMDWLERGEGAPYADPEKSIRAQQLVMKQEKPRRAPEKGPQQILVMASLLGQDLPEIGASVASGVNVSDILDKMKTAYGVKTNLQLAEKHLKVDRTSMTHWVSKNKIPRKYLEKAAEDTQKPLEYFLLQEAVIGRGVEKIIDFVREQILLDRESSIDLDGLRNTLMTQFPEISIGMKEGV